ncbi:hypothetical protein TRFO_25766 [Tritrichomonas foetus]|uniref:Conserved oligomeric Golgi complex subunit 8 n=1 Tax=Tritrichomonas foetus TaxID=1144522 RepID=A0A1J4K4B1_9EUKA|nr:hypothetical protein TRFO_25766 [Tritrichomonas foetus]|eukprot:OHT06223.1 hypothetical protein TRFO_25766 [Tritrichomonas foetus]
MDSDFSNYSLDVLLNEPSRLERSISSLKDQFEQSMTSNYDFFIKTCENASTITDDLESCSENIAKLSQSLSSSIELCSELCLTAQNAVTSNSKISAAFTHLGNVTTILSIPRMMRTCKVSNYPEEALQLYAAIDRFARQYPSLSSVQSALEESKIVRNDVAQTLIDSFTKKMKLTDIIKSVTLLRRAGVNTEAELRLAFVNGRRKKLQAKMAKLNHLSPLSYFDGLTKFYRNGLYKICTWYRALFNGDDADDDLTLHLAVQHEAANYCNALASALDAITDINDARLAMQGALYFMNSLGRLGFDFSLLVEHEFYHSKWAQST